MKLFSNSWLLKQEEERVYLLWTSINRYCIRLSELYSEKCGLKGTPVVFDLWRVNNTVAKKTGIKKDRAASSPE